MHPPRSPPACILVLFPPKKIFPFFHFETGSRQVTQAGEKKIKSLFFFFFFTEVNDHLLASIGFEPENSVCLSLSPQKEPLAQPDLTLRWGVFASQRSAQRTRDWAA